MEEQVKMEEAVNEQVTPTEAPAKEGAKEPTAREKFYSRMKERYPDEDFSDEMAYYSKEMEDYDDLDKRYNEVADREMLLNDFFDKNPKMAAVLSDVEQNVPFPAAMKRYYSDEELSMNEGDEGWDAYLQAEEDYRKGVEDRKGKMKSFEDNIAASEATIKAYAEKEGLDEEQIQARLEKLQGYMNEMSEGKISEDFLNVLAKGIDYDADVEGAADAGYKKGKNEKIETEMANLEGDGLPELSKAQSQVSQPKKDSTAERFKNMSSKIESNNIYRRGGYKPY